MKRKTTIKRVCSLSVLFALVLSMALIVSADEFSGRSLSGGWEFTDNDCESYLLPVRTNDDSWEYWDRAPKLIREAASGDWVIETYISKNTFPVTSGSHAGLVVYKDSKNWILWGVESQQSTTANGVLGGVGYDIHSVYSVYNYLRISKSGNEYTFSCSADGSLWVDMPGKYVDINGYLEGASYGVMGKNWDAYGDNTPTCYVQFEYFKES